MISQMQRDEFDCQGLNKDELKSQVKRLMKLRFLSLGFLGLVWNEVMNGAEEFDLSPFCIEVF